jgi:hypothetical protein
MKYDQKTNRTVHRLSLAGEDNAELDELARQLKAEI